MRLRAAVRIDLDDGPCVVSEHATHLRGVSWLIGRVAQTTRAAAAAPMHTLAHARDTVAGAHGRLSVGPERDPSPGVSAIEIIRAAAIADKADKLQRVVAEAAELDAFCVAVEHPPRPQDIFAR